MLFRSKLTEPVEQNKDHRCQLHSKTIELKVICGIKDCLERQLIFFLNMFLFIKVISSFFSAAHMSNFAHVYRSPQIKS